LALAPVFLGGLACSAAVRRTIALGVDLKDVGVVAETVEGRDGDGARTYQLRPVVRVKLP